MVWMRFVILCVTLISCSQDLQPTNESTPVLVLDDSELLAVSQNENSEESESDDDSHSIVLTRISLLEDSFALYRVRERLARLTLPNYAIGETNKVKGQIVLDGNGKITGDSFFEVEAGSFVSDEDRRDRYIRNRTLEAKRYPTIGFTATKIHSLPWPLPTEGSLHVRLIGDMTIKDVTRVVTWDLEIDFVDDKIDGIATVTISFEEFALEKPKVAVVLSVEDEIQLELNFRSATR